MQVNLSLYCYSETGIDYDYLCAAVASENFLFRVTSTVLLSDTYKAKALVDSECTNNLKIITSRTTIGIAGQSVRPVKKLLHCISEAW